MTPVTPSFHMVSADVCIYNAAQCLQHCGGLTHSDPLSSLICLFLPGVCSVLGVWSVLLGGVCIIVEVCGGAAYLAFVCDMPVFEFSRSWQEKVKQVGHSGGKLLLFFLLLVVANVCLPFPAMALFSGNQRRWKINMYYIIGYNWTGGPPERFGAL